MSSGNDYLTYRQNSFWENTQADYDLYIALLGRKAADEWLEKNRPLHLALEKLWRKKGFTTYRQYEDWEKEHIDERNQFLEKEGVWDLWLNG